MRFLACLSLLFVVALLLLAMWVCNIPFDFALLLMVKGFFATFGAMLAIAMFVFVSAWILK